jgi:hypothetical protein
MQEKIVFISGHPPKNHESLKTPKRTENGPRISQIETKNG